MSKNIIVVAVIASIIIGVGIVLSKYGNTKPGDRPQQGEAIAEQTGTHIAEDTAHDPYNSNPPTSGPHYAQAAAWGIYQQPLPDEQLIHNLEHGGIWICYKDLDQEQINKLEEIARRNPGSVILTPRPANDSKIAVASWGRLEKMDEINEDLINSFIKANKNKSPEKLAL